MARHPTFDRDDVLDRALALFWSRGFAATSVQDLVTATGLGRGSLYAAFGDKAGMFEAALARYGEVVSKRTFAPLLEDDADWTSVTAVFAVLASPDLSAPAPGCLVTNTVCEAAPHDPELKRQLQLAFVGVERRFGAALQRAAARGQLAAHVVPAEAAAFLLALAQGLRVLARLGEPPTRLRLMAETGLRALAAPPLLSDKSIRGGTNR